MTNMTELNNVLKSLRKETIERMLKEDTPLSFDIRLRNVELLLSEHAIEHDVDVPLPEFMTSDELFMIEMLMGA